MLYATCMPSSSLTDSSEPATNQNLQDQCNHCICIQTLLNTGAQQEAIGKQSQGLPGECDWGVCQPVCAHVCLLLTGDV